MDFKNAVKALQIGKKEGEKNRLVTKFGENTKDELDFALQGLKEILNL